MRERLAAWGPAVIWAMLIFTLSTDLGSAERTRGFLEPLIRLLWPTIPREVLEVAHAVVRKSAHVTEYLIFALLLDRGFRRGSGVAPESAPFCALFVAVVYSLGDEWHQSWIASRTPSLFDSGFDSFGAAAGALYSRLSPTGSGRAKTG